MQFLKPALDAWKTAQQDLRFAEHRWQHVSCRVSPMTSVELADRGLEVQSARITEKCLFEVAMGEFAGVARSLDHRKWV